MGKTKPFINKKQSVTFYLTHNDGGSSDSGDEEQGGEAATNVDATAAGTSGTYAGGYDGDTGSVVEGSLWDDGAYTMTAEKRKEMLLMGLPDDGYDYLRHLKAIATGGETASVGKQDAGLSSAAGQFPALNEVPEEGEHSEGDDESPADAAESVSGASVSRTATTSQPPSQQRQIGPVMFIHAANVLRPAADVQLVDARQLSVAGSAGDAEVDAQTATVSAFARPTLPPNRGRLLQPARLSHDPAMFANARHADRLVQEIRELEESMVERETGPGQEAVEHVVEGDEHGDWLDSFVVEATQGQDPTRSRQHAHYQHSERGGPNTSQARSSSPIFDFILVGSMT
ncbi:MAG: hypothetical protein WDW38_001935 [Sanguina aurantia]